MPAAITSMRGPVTRLAPDALADREAVAEVARIYALGIDTRDEAMVLSLFTPDAVVSGMNGTAAARDYFPKLLKGLEPFAATMHAISNQYAIVEGDRARLWSYCVAHHVLKEEGLAHRIATVIYKDELRRAPGGWLIVSRVADHLWRTGW